ncbi:MAG TPA: family 10 glycosylhydrolase [Longimicrobiales bacterium]
MQAIPTPTASDEAPPAPREFRAAWVATVGNIDWPSRPGLSAEQQQQEITQILDRAKEINLNAIVLQVRTTADALYESKHEPWSAYLTGTQGKHPGYDPLKVWIDGAHQRGLELHAWFNPYRTQFSGAKFEPAPNHISKTHPDVNKSYGSYGWMDPGERFAAERSFNVFMDVVERYDVDGIHIDDYFYPYPVTDPQTKQEVPFPDDASYKRYTDAGGQLAREDWRRDNINKLIKRIYDGIKARKKEVEFGISPFGIPRPGLKGIEYVRGFDQYDKLYADTVMWLEKGWCDYFSPQLYWKIGAPQQPYLGLLQWWVNHNPKGRHIYPGLFTSRINFSPESWQPDEILGQITITRLVKGAGGNVHFSMIALDQNRKKVAELLRDGLYAQPALVPSSPWLDDKAPAAPVNVKAQRVEAGAGVRAKPQATPAPQGGGRRGAATAPFASLPPVKSDEANLPALRVTWERDDDGAGDPVQVWAIYYKQGSTWRFATAPGQANEIIIRDDAKEGAATSVTVSAVDRTGNESRRVTIRP